MIKIAICGFGVVGSGVYEVLQINAKAIEKRVGQKVDVKYIVDIRDFSDQPFCKKVVSDFSIVENDPEVLVVVEVIGGSGIAYDITKRALNSGKHVVTSNKELVATHGAELLAIANKRGVNYMFEASVGGGIPIIRPMIQCLSANIINEIYGILNGTTNYILTRMIKAGLTFEEALKEAQDNGYAEKNPEADIEGHDACRKICILASLAFGQHVYPKSVSTEGITKITLDDVFLANKLSYSIKLLGRCIHNSDESIYAYVAPHLVCLENQISGVDDVFNAIMINGNAIDDVMFYGKGAGKLPTASAVVADIIDCAKHLQSRRYISWEDSKDIVRPIDHLKTRFFVRMLKSSANDIGNDFGNVTVADSDKYIGFITSEMSILDITKIIEDAYDKGGILSLIRVL